VPGNFAPFARALERHYGLRTEDVIFFDVHEIADRDHSDVGDNILSRIPMSEEEQARVTRAAQRSLDLWWQFFDGIERASA
jgi:pyrroloquinoline quinone (PQQ) biosynthesis protein C